jgi:4a-hydroxytetrahydrobiopterin dehydratase
MSEMKASKLTMSQVELALKQVPDWKLNANGEIEKTFVSTDFKSSLMFVGAVSLLAEKANHHPDILIQWNRVKLSLITHDSGGLTDKDFELAKKCNELPLL